MSDIEFADGLYVDPPRDGAPDFVVARISVDRERFIEFLEKKDGKYVNLDVQVAKSSGNWYAKVDNWKSTKDEEPKAPTHTHQDKHDDDIPF